ncbi:MULTISPECIES: DUF5050 domain-containing protein [unclassified Paenibacillus]|uniref:DUF5050 domain-containing protein n=1 Tax=Paenibacillus sp. cl123 TaxID=1761875 RepID=UPI00210D9125|nr:MULTISPECIES: DUF5050 domain-containing protein [unclassified Paenibacillus]
MSLKTNKSTKIVDASVSWFRIINNKLYYVKEKDNLLYFSALDGTDETKLSDYAVSWFDSVDGNIFYTSKKEANQFDLYRADPNDEDPLVWNTPVSEVKVLNNQLICRLGDKEDYGFVLLDSSGRELLKVADSISRVLTSDEWILVAASGGSAIQKILKPFKPA